MQQITKSPFILIISFHPLIIKEDDAVPVLPRRKLRIKEVGDVPKSTELLRGDRSRNFSSYFSINNGFAHFLRFLYYNSSLFIV